MGCCASGVVESDWNEDELDEVKALIRDRDAAGNPIMVSLSIQAHQLGSRAARDGDSHTPRNQAVRMDPFAVVFEESVTSESLNPYTTHHSGVVVGRTETQYCTANPSFRNAVVVPFKFEEVQSLNIRFFDEESKLGILREQAYLGEVRVELSTLWSRSPFVDVIVDADSGQQVGIATITATEVKTDVVPEEVVAVFELSGLTYKSKLGKTEPFLTISRVVDQELVVVAKTEQRAMTSAKKSTSQGGESDLVDSVRTEEKEKTSFFKKSNKGTSVLQWSPVHIKVDRLCKGDYSALLVLEVFATEVNGKPHPIGAVRTNLTELLSEGYKQYELINDVKKYDPSYTSSGYLTIESIRVEKCHTFLDFVRGGFDINLTVAIDFTKSNKPFDQERSLHYRRGDNKTNEYMAAIEAVGGVMCCYDKDQEFPVYGFGARLPNDQISHCFPCTMMTDAVEVSGLDGIAEVYWSCLREVEPIEPTYMGPVIRKVSQTAKEKLDAGEMSYQVLLIITDGAISDMRQCIDAIVAASGLPISILIVGVGGGDDFQKMRVLDADDVPLVSSSGDIMRRDIVGFVPFREYRHLEPDVLARECLREIPRQFTTWTRQNRICLPDPTDAPINEIREKRSRAKLQSDNPDRLPSDELEAAMKRRTRTPGNISTLFNKTKDALRGTGTRPESRADLHDLCSSTASLQDRTMTEYAHSQSLRGPGDLEKPLLRRHPSGGSRKASATSHMHGHPGRPLPPMGDITKTGLAPLTARPAAAECLLGSPPADLLRSAAEAPPPPGRPPGGYPMQRVNTRLTEPQLDLL